MSKNIIIQLKKREIGECIKIKAKLIAKCQIAFKINIVEDVFDFEDYWTFITTESIVNHLSPPQLSILEEIDDYLYETCICSKVNFEIEISDDNLPDYKNWRSYLEIVKQSELIGWLSFQVTKISLFHLNSKSTHQIFELSSIDSNNIQNLSPFISHLFYDGIVRLCGFLSYDQSCRWKTIQS